MNIVITLPEDLISAILEGKKKFEMRKSFPHTFRRGRDGFFVVQKGTKDIICWCRIDCIEEAQSWSTVAFDYAKYLCVNDQYIKDYMKGTKKIYLWQIGKVIKFNKGALKLSDLFVNRAPQQFAYCPLSYGESF